MFDNSTTTMPLKKEDIPKKYPWKDTGNVQLSMHFIYTRDKAGGVIEDLKGMHYGCIARLSPDDTDTEDFDRWCICELMFGGVLFNATFFESLEQPDGSFIYPNECESEQVAVLKFFSELTNYLHQISKV